MGRIRAMKAWGFFSLLIFLGSGASFSYAQWSDCGVNTCTNDNVGIGTTSPEVLPLDINSVAGNATGIALHISEVRKAFIGVQANAADLVTGTAANDFVIRSGDTATNFHFSTAASGASAAMTITSSGNVGIGTMDPANQLDVVRSQNASTQILVSNTNSGSSAQAGVKFTADGGDSYIYRASIAAIGGVGNATVVQDNGGGDIVIYGAAEIMRAKNNGNVGIGTTSPTSKLHVAGAAKITGNTTVDGDISAGGNIAAKYQDVAEWVRAGAALEPGTVVVIDPAKDDQVLPASQAYDTRVAGVVSAQPGIILGEAGDDKAKVAHSGRVKVKADAQFGPISVGDLLVSSAAAGYAMVSRPIDLNGISLHRPGTIVGKALEPLKEGQGEILVLLTLQ